MSPVYGVSQAGQSLEATWNRIGQKVDELAAQVSQGDAGTGSYLKAVVELKSLELQGKVAGAIFRTLHDLSDDLLTRPRK